MRARRTRLRQDPTAAERFGELAGTPLRVRAADGVPLYVEEAGDRTAPLTVVFVHGYVLDRRCWHYQWRDLRDLGRLVCYDQRGHGHSGRGSRGHATIDQLGQDLRTVLDGVAPTGAVMLVGHSMGGMAILALVEQYPELLGDRVRAVALLSTSTGRLAEVTLGLPVLATRVLRRVTPMALLLAERRPGLVEGVRRLGGEAVFRLTRRYSFGSGGTRSLVAFVDRMTAGVPVEVMTEFLSALLDHDKAAALPALRAVPTLVLVGSEDKQTPVSHAREIAAGVPGAELVVVPGAGHIVMLERPDVVNAHLRALIQRSTGAPPRADQGDVVAGCGVSGATSP